MNYLSEKNRVLFNTLKYFSAAIITILAVFIFTGTISASAAKKNTAKTTVKTVSKVTLSTPKMTPTKTIDSDYTHPYNRQTSQINVRWNKVNGAQAYQLYIKGGKYKNWKLCKYLKGTSFTVKNLTRATTYYFKVRAVSGKTYSSFSQAQKIPTARINYDKNGWQAICRIVYHEVGMINTSAWDRPIVYVADCVVNRYVQAKYMNDPLWAPYYRKYNNIQSMIYNSGGFMSSAGLARDGAVYSRVNSRVKTAVMGAVYAQTTLRNIKNDYNIFYWCNRSYKQNSKKIAYSFKIPWGYFNIWRSYWG